MERSERLRRRVVRARVVRWDRCCFGVAIDYADDRQLTYGVGTWNQALDEAARMRRQRVLPIKVRQLSLSA
jgi:hypothetical protein